MAALGELILSGHTSVKHFPYLLKHELRNLALSPATYTTAVALLFLLGLFYLNVLVECSREAQTVAPAAMFFKSFWIPAWFAIPLLTMRSIAEERRRQTLEIMITAPVTITEVVLSKFLAAWLGYCLLWALSLLFPFIAAWQIDDPVMSKRLLAPLPLIGGYCFVALSSLLFIAIGILASSVTRTQLVAGMLSFILIFILTFGAGLNIYQNNLLILPSLKTPWEYLPLLRHWEDFSLGIFDSRTLFLYLSSTGLILGLTILILEAKMNR